MDDQKNDMSIEEGTENRELAPGVILYKEYRKMNQKDTIGLFIWKVEITTMSVVDFEVHLDQSENIELAGTSPGEELKTINRLEPFETKEVARVILKNNWKLKSKFKLTMNIPEKETQMHFIKDDEAKLKKHIQEGKEFLSNIPIDTMAREDIEKELEKYKIRFVDLDFMPNDDAMVNNRFMENMKDLLDYVVHWRRPEEFCFAEGYSDEIKVFSYKDPEPNDIQQGILSDNYFASSLSALAERYNLVKRLFRNDNFSKYGIYQVKLCISGEWTCITVDDYFPCIPQSNPLVSRSPDNELWVLILEKAVAKVYECYFALTHSSLGDLLLMLTGCPTFNLLIEEIVQEQKDIEKLWKKLKQFVVEKKYIVVALSKIQENLDNVSESDDNTLTLSNYGYTIIDVKNKYDSIFIFLRKIWYDPKKDDKCKQYEDELVKKNPTLKNERNEGTLILALDDFIREFGSITVCYTRNWEEVRIRGKFVSVIEEESKLECVLSKWYYTIELEKQTNIIISLHQDEDKIRFSESRKQIMDLSIAILKKENETNEITLIESIDFTISPNVQIELNLPPGTYIILPRNTGCFFGRPFDKTNVTPIQFYNREEKKLNPIFVSTIKDIFKKFDMLLNRQLKYNEFKGFWECINNKEISPEEFRTKILSKYLSSNEGITEKGFIKFFEDNLLSPNGEKTVSIWLQNLGYDSELYPLRSRCFMLTFHSDYPVAVSVRDALNTDLNSKTNLLIIKNFGQEKAYKQGNNEITAIEYHSKNNSVISVGILNKSPTPFKVTLDFTQSKNLLFSSKNPKIEKIVYQNQIEFFLHFYCLSDETGSKIENLGYNISFNPYKEK